MITTEQVLAAAGTFIATYIFYQALGPSNRSLFFSREQKEIWDTTVKEGLGDWLVVTGIFGTLTGFATYLFLLGSAKLFGLFALSTGITIALSAPITKALTRPFLKDARIGGLFKNNDQVSSVIATLFWTDTPEGRLSARMVKWISLFVIFTIIWLECTAFVDLSFWIAGFTRADDTAILHWRFIILFLVAFSIVYFVLGYGIRGFVFADLLHAPVIGLAAIVVLAGAFWLTKDLLAGIDLSELASPFLSTPDPILGVSPGWIFAFHVLVLNLFQITCTEHHWFRMWLFGERELQRQALGTGLTGLVWLLMLPVGFMAFTLSGQPGEPAIGALVAGLDNLFPVFGLLFWIGATAALFSTADMQIYSALLVSRFNAKRGTLNEITLTPVKSLIWSLIIATGFGLAYTGVRAVALPLEKIIFVVVPLCVVLLPAFLHYYWGREVRAWVLGTSFIGYVGLACWGFLVTQFNFAATLCAVFVPLFVSVVSVWFVPKRIH